MVHPLSTTAVGCMLNAAVLLTCNFYRCAKVMKKAVWDEKRPLIQFPESCGGLLLKDTIIFCFGIFQGV